MRILLDECVPRPLKRELPGHDVHTVPEMGWSGKKNGALLQLMLADNFEVFLTVDQNLRYQQNLRAARIAVIVLVAPTNRIADLLPLMPSVITSLGTVQPGDLVEITV
jgi:PIN domain-containing protein